MFDWLRVWLSRGMAKAMAVNWLPEWSRASFMTPTYQQLTHEGYRANGIVFACVATLAFSFPEPKLRILNGKGQPIENHPALKVLNRPNRDMGLAAFLQHSIIYQAVGGNVYWYKVRSKAKQVVELYPLNDSQINPVAGGNTFVSHYEWDTGDGQPKSIPAEDILQIKWLPDPLEPWRGIAPLKAVVREVDSDNEAGRYQFALLKNDAIPRVVLTSPAGPPMTPEQVKRLREEWADRYGGMNRGMPMILGNGLDVKTLSMDLQQLAFEALRRVPEARLCAAFRVPPVIVGLNVGLEQMTYNNVGGMRRHFTEETLVPFWRSYGDAITTNLLPEFGEDDARAEFDLDTVVSLREAATERRTFVDNAVRNGYMTVNEGRAELGLDPVPAGDVFLRSMATVVEPIDAEPATEPTVTLGSPQNEPAATDETPDEDEAAKAIPPGRKLAQIKARRNQAQREAAASIIRAQRTQRDMVARRMGPAVNNWFAGLAERVVHRAIEAGKGGKPQGERKALPAEDDLIHENDWDEFQELSKSFYIELLRLSWDTWNIAMGITADFTLTDPAVTRALALAGTRIREIQDTTLARVRDLLQWGNEHGWSIDMLVRGDRDAGMVGLRDIVAETYKNRGETIARTELGNAQQAAAVERYQANGVEKILIYDNGFDDSAPGCIVLGKGGAGTIVPADHVTASQLGHPNCVRCTSPYFGDEPVDEDNIAAWEAAGGDR